MYITQIHPYFHQRMNSNHFDKDFFTDPSWLELTIVQSSLAIIILPVILFRIERLVT